MAKKRDSIYKYLQTLNVVRKNIAESIYIDSIGLSYVDKEVNKYRASAVVPFYKYKHDDDRCKSVFKTILKKTGIPISDTTKINLDPPELPEISPELLAAMDNQKFTEKQRTNQLAFMSCLSKYAGEIGITNKTGLCIILAQVAHESNNFRAMAEYGKGVGMKYGVPDGPYGKIYYGRGPVQVTWYGNYKSIYNGFFKKVGFDDVDVIKEPDLALDPIVGSMLSIGWFKVCGKRAIAAANKGDVLACTKAINGGTNGLEDRQKKTRIYADLLGIDQSTINFG